MNLKPIKVGLLGMGTVGSGVFTVLKRNQEEIFRRAGRSIEIAMVADLDTTRAQAAAGPGVTVVADARAVIANPTPFPERYAFLLYGVLALGLGLYYIFLVLRLKRRQKVKKDPPRRIIL